MLAKGYHIQRLKPEIEENVRKILREGSDKVIGILHEHFKGFDPDDSVMFFEQVLIQVATTVSKVASLPELNFDLTKKKRIAFLPGYTMKGKEKKRVAHKVKFEKGFIPSDIAFNINGKERVERVKESVTNQALLYYHLLEHHDDDDKFSEGGTHQFLITNATSLRTKSEYHLDLLQVYTGNKNSKPQDEITFLTIEVDFKKLNTVAKLYNHFDKILNKGNPAFRWPLNIKDEKGDYSKKSATYKMRGYLVSLWYKILHDTNKKNIDEWFTDCINFAGASGFEKLKERLQKLQKAITINNGEHYSFWYSLAFNPLPDFTAPDKPEKETLGSAMLMTNFELKPQFFFWVQPWVNRIYRHIRDFETLGLAISKTREEDLNKHYTGDRKYKPTIVQGGRLYKPGKQSGSKSKGYGHDEPLIYYYQEFFGTETEANIKALYEKAISLVNSITLIHLIQLTYNSSIPSKLETIINNHCKEIDKILPARKFSFNAVLNDHTKAITKTCFKNRLLGRMSTLIFYCSHKLTIEHIHGIHFKKTKKISESFGDVKQNAYSVLRASFFIEGLGSNDDVDSRNHAIEKVKESVSQYEKELIDAARNSFENFLNSKTDIDNTEIANLKTQVNLIFR